MAPADLGNTLLRRIRILLPIAGVTPKSHTGILQPGPPEEDENHPGLHH